MSKRRFIGRNALLSAAVAWSVVGCGTSTGPTTGVASPSVGPTTTAAGSPSAQAPSSSPPTRTADPTPSPTRAPSASPASATFESRWYRYAIALPPGIQTLNWRPALRPWDGVATLDRAGPYTDRTGVTGGGLFLYGAEAESLEEWFASVEGNGARHHGCSAAQNRVDVTIAGVPAIAFTQTCNEGVNMARVALWKDGWGIGVWHGEVPVSELPAARDRAIELLDELEWRPG